MTAAFRVFPVRGPPLEWLEKRAGCVLTRNARGIAAIDGRGQVRGMVACDDWTDNAFQYHMAVDSPAAWRVLLLPALRFPFEEAGRRVAVAVIRESNARSLALARHVGFLAVGRIRDGFAVGEDLVQLELRREDCRYLKDARWSKDWAARVRKAA